MDNNTNEERSTLGMHLANRLVEIGCSHAFGVPGDYNLLLLDELLKQKDLTMVWCCNELNAGYAADGFARSRGIGCVVVTFTVGGLSVLNAVAGAYAEDLPVIVVSGAPNSNDFASNRILHHTIGLPDFNQELRCFREVTCCQVTIRHLDEAHRAVDYAISQALINHKPALIQVSCNIAGSTHPTFVHTAPPYVLPACHTNRGSLQHAVDAAIAVLNHAQKPVLIGGPRLRPERRKQAFLQLADACQYPVALLPDAKGMFPETYPRFMGIYWGAVSWPYVCEVVESADLVVVVGSVFTDYTTVGYSLLLKPDKMIKIDESHMTIRGAQTFSCIDMVDMLTALVQRVKPNDTAWGNFMRMYIQPSPPSAQAPNEPLTTKVLYKHIQAFLSAEHAIIAEVGDSWFNSQKLRLPEGCCYEMQMRYGSIGWSVGATLGYAVAAGQSKRVLALIGDGSYQMTCQAVSTIIRYGQNPIIILINNGGYTIEVEIHDGPYNIIKNWNYEGIVKDFANNEGKAWTCKVRTESELVQALEAACGHVDHLVFVEVHVHRDDTSKELLEWGSRVAAANSRPPKEL